jgi:AcrR family transcriptional regulator
MNDQARSSGAPAEDRRLTARGEERRRQIVEVSTRLFAKDGYHPTSVADVVEAVGVGKGVFYWYFPSKEALLEEILRSGQTARRRVQRDAIAGIDDPVEQMERGIRSGMEWMAEHRDLVTLTRFAATEERFPEGLRKGEDIAAADAAAPLRRAIEEGRIPDADPDLLARAVVGVTQHLCASLIHVDPDSDPTPIIDATGRFCLGGILGAPAATTA